MALRTAPFKSLLWGKYSVQKVPHHSPSGVGHMSSGPGLGERHGASPSTSFAYVHIHPSISPGRVHYASLRLAVFQHRIPRDVLQSSLFLLRAGYARTGKPFFVSHAHTRSSKSSSRARVNVCELSQIVEHVVVPLSQICHIASQRLLGSCPPPPLSEIIDCHRPCTRFGYSRP